jgi:uncharacterized protein (TIGR02118 family)
MKKTTLFVMLLVFLAGLSRPETLTAQAHQQVADHHKAIFFCKKKEGLSDADFRDWVLNTHVPMVKQFPRIRGYVQNFVTDTPEGFPYDLVVEIWFDHAADMAAAYEAEIGKQAVADVENGLAEFPSSMTVHEVAVIDAPFHAGSKQPGYKVLWMAERHPELDYKDYQLAQLMHYSPIAKRVPGMLGYTLNFLQQPEKEAEDGLYSAVVGTWWASPESAMEGLNTEAIMKKLKPKQGVMLAGPPLMVPVEKHVLIQPPNYQQAGAMR